MRVRFCDAWRRAPIIVRMHRTCLPILPDAYKIYGVVDAAERVKSYRRQAIQTLLAAGQFAPALPLIEQDPDARRSSRPNATKAWAICAKRPKSSARWESEGCIAQLSFDSGFRKGAGVDARDRAASRPRPNRWSGLAELRQVLEKRPQNLVAHRHCRREEVPDGAVRSATGWAAACRKRLSNETPRKPATKPRAKRHESK